MPVRRRKEQRLAGGRPPSWVIDFRDSTGARHRRTVDGRLPKRDVEALERRLRDEAEEGVKRLRRPPALRAVLARYWDEHGQHIASWPSERGYLDRWDAALGPETPITHIGPAEIAAAVAGWRGQVADSTINRYLSALQRIWRRAEDLWQLRLQRVPWSRLKLHEPEPRDRSIPPAARPALLAALPPRSRALVELALLTGLRRGALLRLTRDDIDMERGVIRAVSKGRAGGKPTPVPITTAVRELLERLPLPEVGRLFPLSITELRRDWQRARKAAGLPHARIHDLRHSTAQDLEDAGQGDAISDVLHHSDPKLRRRYAQARIERTREAMERAQKRNGGK